MNVLPEALEELTSRLDTLEKRVYALEHSSEASALQTEQLQDAHAAAPATEESAIEQASSVFPVLGKAMLGIAGAYLLRAVAETSPIPRQAVAAVAIAYALGWLVWAARAKSAARYARSIYAGASVLILAPMLWELTLRFNTLSPTLAAVVLSGFVITATAEAWKGELAPVFSVAYGGAALTAVALSIATHQMLPFLFALLLIVLLCEYSAAHDRGQAVRPLVAAVADVAVWSLIFIYSGPQANHTDYPALGKLELLAPACLLFLVVAASISIRSGVFGKKITIFETVQALIAFLLAAASVLYFVPADGEIAVGSACLLLSAGCYATTFARFRSTPEQRNFRVFSAWSAGLFLAGVLWSLPPAWGAACLGVTALTAVVLGVRKQCLTLDLHGVAYLAAAAVASGLLEYTFHTLVGPLPTGPSWDVFVVSACAAVCYAAGKERAGEAWMQQVLHLVPALLAACALAALMAEGLLRVTALFITLDVFHVAFIRTLTVCSVALALAFGGARWLRLEMTRIAYAALAFEAAKLLFEDLRHGQMEFIAGSIFLFALTLIGVPRLARAARKM